MGRRLTASRPHRPGRDYRTFDPVSLGTLESRVWVAYYRRDWLTFIRTGVVCARANFGLSWRDTLACSWLVMRANQRWAPYPRNDADGARRAMTRVYRVLADRYGHPRDPVRAAELDVDWWRVHRELQHGLEETSRSDLRDAISRFWEEIYDVPASRLSEAASRRASAMGLSDRWVAAGCPPDSPLLTAARADLVSSYGSLLQAVEPA